MIQRSKGQGHNDTSQKRLVDTLQVTVFAPLIFKILHMQLCFQEGKNPIDFVVKCSKVTKVTVGLHRKSLQTFCRSTFFAPLTSCFTCSFVINIRSTLLTLRSRSLWDLEIQLEDTDCEGICPVLCSSCSLNSTQYMHW